MLDFKKAMNSEKGVLLFSIILGLGVAGLFKMSCDSRSCLIYKGPDFQNKRQIKVNDKCYNVSEEIINCEENDKKDKIFV
jgi:hypothetical protein